MEVYKTWTVRRAGDWQGHAEAETGGKEVPLWRRRRGEYGNPCWESETRKIPTPIRIDMCLLHQSEWMGGAWDGAVRKASKFQGAKATLD